jgi:hypothetical protein
VSDEIKNFRLPDGSILPHAEDGNGTWRALGCLPPHSDFGGLPKFSSSQPTIPRSEWKDFDLSGYDAPILNQGSHGSCVGHGAVTAFWRLWLMQNLPPQQFSACFTYGLINGGRDSGAVISDALTSMTNDGVGLLSDVPEGMVYRSQFPAAAFTNAKRFKVRAAHHCQNFDEICSALLLGFPVVYGVYVGGSFGNLDSEGVAPAWPNRVGNHCLSGKALKKLSSGDWGVRTQNSWGASWGQQGNCYLVERHFTGTDPDAFAIELDYPEISS